MGIKKDGYYCDNCKKFSTFEKVIIPDNILLDTINENGVNYILKLIMFKKNVLFNFYNVEEIKKDDEVLIKWGDNSECYCKECDRIIKIKNIIKNKR